MVSEWVWVFVGFMVALFCDNLFGFLWAYWFGPSRAKKLVMEGLKDPILGRDIRPLWGLPSYRQIKSMEGRIYKHIDERIAEVKTGAEVYISEKDKDKVVASLSTSMRRKLKDDMDDFYQGIEDLIDKRLKELKGAERSPKEEELFILLGDPEVQREFVESAEDLGLKPHTAKALVERGPDAIYKFGVRTGLWARLLEKI